MATYSSLDNLLVVADIHHDDRLLLNQKGFGENLIVESLVTSQKDESVCLLVSDIQTRKHNIWKYSKDF